MSKASASCILALLTAGLAPAASAQPPPGDITGDGLVNFFDLMEWNRLWGSTAGDADYDAAADLDDNGIIGGPEFVVFSTHYGTRGDPDTTPPGVFPTLNHIPDDMNDLLVVPPDGFEIVVVFDNTSGSILDLGSLEIQSDLPMGPHPAGSNLAPLFQVNPLRAVWRVPTGSDLARTTHTLTVRVSDLAGNETEASYGYAVRDFPNGAPLGSTQTVFLDFDQDRSLGPEIDFVEDLREYGLSSASAPVIEAQVRAALVDEILRRVRPHYGLEPDGSPGVDPVNIVFAATKPASPHSRLCVGGRSDEGALFLGAATLDENNVAEASDECGLGTTLFGVFPQAIDDLWGAQPDFQAAFAAVDPDLGGTPFGEHLLDAAIAAPDFDPKSATPAQRERASGVKEARDAFAQVVATATAHEVGHMLGLVAHEAPPAGLYGGTSGGATDHNVTPTGGTPPENYVMNAGGSISFLEISGRGPSGVAVFRPLNWAYLHDRVVLDANVTGLFPPVDLQGVAPSTLVWTATSPENQLVTLSGQNFQGQPVVELLRDGVPTPNPVFGVTVVDARTATGYVNRFFVTPAVYDVRIVNGDGQVDVLEDALGVVFQ